MKIILLSLMFFVASLAVVPAVKAGRCPDPEDFTCELRESCKTPLGLIRNGESVVAYQAPVVRAPVPCAAEVRRCNSGELSGSYAYPSCNQLPSRGRQVPDGE